MTISSMNATYYNYGLLGLVVIVFGILIPKKYNLVVGVLAMIFALSWFGEFEFMRESIRKPYIIHQYMYGNGLEVAKADLYQEEGMLTHMAFRTGDDGADLFRRACRSCHTIDGYKALKPAYDGTDATFIAGTIRGTEIITNGIMPPFLGNDEEVELLATHIYKQVDQREFTEIYKLEGVELGKKVFDVRCGRCHAFGSENDKSESLVGLSEEDYIDLLDMAGDFADEMPPFTGNESERDALIQYFLTLEEGGTQ